MRRLMWMMVTVTAGLTAACGGDTQTPADDTGADTSTTDATTSDDVGGGETTACTPAANDDGEPYACVGGTIVDEDGTPIAGLKVSACTLATCIIGETGEDGRYRIGKLPVGPHKMEILGQIQGYATMIYYQPVTAGVLVEAEREIVMVRLTETPSPWTPADGGAVSLAGEMLDLEVAPGALRYPLGTVDKAAVAVEMDPLDLPPFDIAPWEGKEAGTRVFIVNPFPMQSSSAVAMTVHGATGVAPDTGYDVYTANHLEGVLEHVGTATADGLGDIVLDGDAELLTLTTIIVVPQG